MMLARRHLLAAPLALALPACTARGDRLHFWAMGNEGAMAPRLLPAGARIDVQALPWTAAHEKLLTAYAGDALPDVSQIGNTWLAELAALGALAPLPAAERDLLDDQFPAVLAANRIGDVAYGIPWYVDTRLQFYRTDLLAAAGYDAPPADWASWKTALHRVKRRAGADAYAILLPVDEFEQLLTFALQQPDPLLRDDNAYGNFRSPGFRAALAFYKSLFDEGLAPVAASTQIANVWNEFARGFFAVYLSGPWTIGDLTRRLPPALAGRWATAGMPGPAGPGASAPGGSSLVVFRSARDPAAAWALVRHLSQPATQARFFGLTGDLPARRTAWAAPALAGDANIAQFGRQLARATPVPKVPEWERIVTEMQVVAERMVRDQFGVDQAAAEIDARADRLLAKRRWMLDRGRAA